MDKQFMLFSKRKELAEEYEKWVNTPLEDGSKIKDCTLSVIAFMQTKGYRKIPENSVVLTPAERDEEMRLIREDVINRINATRKETAKKFAERVKMAFYYEFDELIPSIMADKIDEICKELEGEK